MLANELKKQTGLTLIEITVAFSVLIIAFVGLTKAFPLGLSINKRAESATVASYLAQDKIEELFALNYDEIATGTIETRHRLSDSEDNYLYIFERETKVDYIDGDLATTTTNQGLKKVSATVYYTEPISKGESRYNITTLISQK